MEAQEVLSILPHRFPFIMIDRVREVTDDHIIAVKNVSLGEPFFQGHFPGMPIMPGVLIVEAMAQAGALLAAETTEFDRTKQVVMFMAINNVKFRKPVTPGDQLILKVTPLRRGRIWKMKGEATVEGAAVCQAEFLATMAKRS